MDFLLSPALVKYELILLIANYIITAIFIIWPVIAFIGMIKEAFFKKKPEPLNIVFENIESEDIEENVDEKGVEENIVAILTKKEKDVLSDIIKIAKVRIARGEFSDAINKIVEGLSVDKFNKELNCLLALIYEKDKDYKKAELIYKDLIMLNEGDVELYTKLGFALSLQGKYEIAYEIYKKGFSFDETNIEIIEMLANLANLIGLHTESKKYAKIFLKNNPRNADMLYVLAQSHLGLKEKEDTLEVLKKIKNIDPYNISISSMMEKLETELELEKNFKRE